MKESKKRIPVDVTALSSDDWSALNDLLQKAARRASQEAIGLGGRERLVTPFNARHTLLARRLKGTRNQRDRFFDGNLFSEPAWDILLTLFIADTEGYRMAMGEVADACNIPLTTSLRWYSRLQDLDLIQRWPNRTNNRIVYLSLSPAGFARMTALLDAVSRNVFNESD